MNKVLVSEVPFAIRSLGSRTNGLPSWVKLKRKIQGGRPFWKTIQKSFTVSKISGSNFVQHKLRRSFWLTSRRCCWPIEVCFMV